jgi:uncharacterized protein (DUF1778 family)
MRRRPDLVQSRVAKDEKRAFELAADLVGLTLSGWVRDRARRAAEEELTKAGQPVAFLKLRKK